MFIIDGEIDDVSRAALELLARKATERRTPPWGVMPIDCDPSQFSASARREVCQYPGGSYILWIISFRSHRTGEVLESSPHLWAAGDYQTILQELANIH